MNSNNGIYMDIVLLKASPNKLCINVIWWTGP